MDEARAIQPRELIAVAGLLATGDGNTPPLGEAGMRRAISTAYYAVFHDFSAKATHLLLNSDVWGAAESAVARWMTHTNLKNLSQATRAAPESSPLRTALGVLHPDVERITANVFELEEAWTGADYNDLYVVSRPQTLRLVRLADQTLSLSDELYSRQDRSYPRLLRLLTVGAKSIRR